MRKKFIILMLMSIFLIGAVNFISADDVDGYSGNDAVGSVEDSVADNVQTSDDSNDNSQNVGEKVNLTIKLDWKDQNSPNRPTSVTVYVMKDGQKVESVVLSNENGWTKSVEVNKFDDSGKEISYSVSADRIGSYKDPAVSKNGDEFTVTNELNQVLSSSPQDTLKENSSDVQNVSDDDKNSSDEDKTVNNTNITVNNKTINNTTINNKTINNTTINNKIINNTVVNNKNINKTPKDAPKKDNKDKQKKSLLNTGNPILILIIVIIVVAVAYYFYSKR